MAYNKAKILQLLIYNSLYVDSKYEGKSALRTADSPSKPHRATIVDPKSTPDVPEFRYAPR